jgi:hypothetical protein
MKNIKRLLSVVITVITIAGCLAGCNNGAKTTLDSKKSETSKTSGDNVTSGSGKEVVCSGEVHFAFWGDMLVEYYESMVSEFNKLYPNVKVYIENSTPSEYWTKLEAATTGGSAADVFRINGPNIVKYVKAGMIEPLDEYIKRDGVNLKDYPEGMVNLYNLNGIQYGIPCDYDTIAVWYNKSLFDKAGVGYPKDGWSWDEFVNTAKALTKSDGSVYGVNADPANQTGYYNTIFEAGGYVISEDKKSSGYDKPETKAGVQLWIDLLDAGVSPALSSFAETKADAQFYSGRLAMYFGGSWKAGYIKTSDIADDVDVVSLPSVGGNLKSVIHGCANVVNANSENKEAAWAWAKFLTDKEAQDALGKTGKLIPCCKGSADLWVQSNPKMNLQIFMKEADNNSVAYPVSEKTSEWNDLETTYMTKIFNKEVTVEEGCNELAKKMNEVLATED